MAEDADDEWRYSLADLEDEAAEAEMEDGNIAGSLVPGATLEPGDVRLEHAVFVALGAIVAGAALVAFVLALT